MISDFVLLLELCDFLLLRIIHTFVFLLLLIFSKLLDMTQTVGETPLFNDFSIQYPMN